VNLRKKRLLDETTTLSTPAKLTSGTTPSIKLISTGTPADTIFADFPELIRPSGIQRNV
jgi:hypothetical protein